MSSPTARSLAALRKDGWTAQVVEKWHHFARVRQDLFGCIDILAIKPGRILGIQATSTASADRMKKALGLPGLKSWLEAGGEFQVWGVVPVVRKGKRKRYRIKKIIITLEGMYD